MLNKRKYPNFLSEREEEILRVIGKYNENSNVAHERIQVPRTGTYMTSGGVRSHMTRIFKRYVEAQTLIAEYYDVFNGRLKKHESYLKSIQRETAKRKRNTRK